MTVFDRRCNVLANWEWRLRATSAMGVQYRRWSSLDGCVVEERFGIVEPVGGFGNLVYRIALFGTPREELAKSVEVDTPGFRFFMGGALVER